MLPDHRSSVRPATEPELSVRLALNRDKSVTGWDKVNAKPTSMGPGVRPLIEKNADGFCPKSREDGVITEACDGIADDAIKKTASAPTRTRFITVSLVQ